MGHCRYSEAVDDTQFSLRSRLELLESAGETMVLELAASFCYDKMLIILQVVKILQIMEVTSTHSEPKGRIHSGKVTTCHIMSQ